MAKYELAIAVNDKLTHTVGKFTVDEGDIVSVKPYPRNPGRKIIDHYLVEQGRGILEYPLQVLLRGNIRVAVDEVPTGAPFAHMDGGDASRDLYSCIQKRLLGALQRRSLSRISAPERLNVDVRHRCLLAPFNCFFKAVLI